MTAREVRAVALSLPETHEEAHFDRASFRVGKRIFATMAADGLSGMVRVPDANRLEALLAGQSDVFFSFGGWTRRNWALGVHFGRIDSALMRELLTEAWQSVVPRRLLKTNLRR